MNTSIRSAPRLAIVGAVFLSAVTTGAHASMLPQDGVVPNELTARTLRIGGTRINVSAYRRSTTTQVCVWAYRIERVSPTRRITTQEGECDLMSGLRHGFDPVAWNAHLRGMMKVRHMRDVHVLIDGIWHQRSSRMRTTLARLDLSWAGQGDPRPIADVRGFPLSCYTLPPICTYVRAEVQRDAVVYGTFEFEGIGLRAPVPPGHRGLMTLN